MDPQVAWDRLLSAYADGDWDQIEEHAEALLGWLDRGGFPPRVVSHTDLQDFDRTLAYVGCRFALEALHGRWQIQCNHAEALN